MNSLQAIAKLKRQLQAINSLSSNSRKDSHFKKWKRDTEVTISNIFGYESTHLIEFLKIDYTYKNRLPNNISIMNNCMSVTDYDRIKSYQNTDNIQYGIKEANLLLQSFIEEIEEYWSSKNVIKSKIYPENNSLSNNHSKFYFDTIHNIELICSRFHQVVRQMRSRHDNRPTLEINDEYDVQDLFNSLLTLYFDDIRREESNPSYAGSNSRSDFLLKPEQTVIEIKKTRSGLNNKKLGEELILDINKYQTHPDCETLVCFVYDPEGRISNPRGLEKDLEQLTEKIEVKVFIRSF
ncbi:MAG: hypothetical protein AAGE84_20950 [Cyanobacteria bacterium P01_G01_bin.39]